MQSALGNGSCLAMLWRDLDRQQAGSYRTGRIDLKLL